MAQSGHTGKEPAPLINDDLIMQMIWVVKFYLEKFFTWDTIKEWIEEASPEFCVHKIEATINLSIYANLPQGTARI